MLGLLDFVGDVNKLVASMSKLYDISIFDTFFEADFKDSIDFEKTRLYIADAYQANLDSYKPHKTTRIGIWLSDKEIWDGKPWFNGSICHLPASFDKIKYPKLNPKEASHYLLDLMHSTIMEFCEELKWEKSKFEQAYLKTLKNNLQYLKEYPVKTARDKKNHAQVVVRKTQEYTIVYFRVNSMELKVYEIENRFYEDPTDKFVSKNKWFDNNAFGICASVDEFRFFYSLANNKLAYRIDPKYADENNLKKRFKKIIDQIEPTTNTVFM